jgi:RNA polymerase sigma-70 factor (ECF subfamily)
MTENSANRHLSQITTLWTLVARAHRPGAADSDRTRGQLLERYWNAICRYLRASLGDPNRADELAQDFAVRFLRGDFRRADPERGRFRDYLKTALFHLIHTYRKCDQVRPLPADELADDDAPAWEPAEDDAFLASWREELLARTWEGLAAVEEETGQPYHTVLRFRITEPLLASAESAEKLSAKLGRRLTAAGLRQILHRARERFTNLLLDEVSHSLQTTNLDAIEQELVELGLLCYCKTALERRRASA